MKIKNNKELALLASVSKQSAESLSDKIVSELINGNIIITNRINWGEPIANCTGPEVKMSDIAGIMERAGIAGKSTHFSEFIRLIVMGDGDCPECGGDTEVVDGRYKQTGGFDYDSEPEYTTIWERCRCTNCGFSESSEPEYEKERNN